jgi:Protein of unknown function (DUF2934)
MGAECMAEQVEPTQAQIRRRAYELFEERGREHGGDFADWLAAEQQLRALAFENVMRVIVERRNAAPLKTPIPFEGAASAAA